MKIFYDTGQSVHSTNLMIIERFIAFKWKKLLKSVHYRKEITPKKKLWPGCTVQSNQIPTRYICIKILGVALFLFSGIPFG